MTETEAKPKGRWLFWMLVPLALLFVLALGFKGRLFMAYVKYKLDPGKPFAAFTPPKAPDYSRSETWVALPTKKDYADYVPTGVTQTKGPRKADVFFIHPTTYMTSKSWNAPIDNPKAKERIDTAVTKHQASTFNACCRVYAPYYRQATLYFAFAFEPNGKAAIELAYQDVVRAFRHYIKHWNKGRPFILAGHSQGAIHGLRLLEEHIVKTPLQKQLVAAYIVGNPIHKDKLKRTLAPLHVCQHAADTRCVISWMSIGKRANVRRYSRLPKFYPPKGYEDVKKRENICVNPINWRADDKPAGFNEHLGAVRYKRGPDPLPAPQPGTVRGQCKQGGMVIHKPQLKPGFNRQIFGKDDFHIYDYNLFYMNIRKNAVTRVNAFLKQQAKAAPQPAPPARDAKAPSKDTKAPTKDAKRPAPPTRR